MWASDADLLVVCDAWAVRLQPADAREEAPLAFTPRAQMMRMVDI